MKHLNIIFLLMSLSVVSFAQKEAKLIRKGNSQFKKGDFKNAEINYRKSLELNTNSLKGEFNLGDALYSQENYEESAKIFDGLREKITDGQQKSEVYHNLGNSLLESEKYKESIEAYKQALRSNPNDMDTKYNLEYARQKLEEQEDQQQQDQNQDQNKDEENKDEEQKQDQQDQNKDQEQQEDKKDQEDQQGEQDKDNQEKPQPKQISKQDAERMLEALKNEEKKTLEKLKKEQAKNVKGKKVEKDW